MATKHLQPNFFSRATSWAMHLPISFGKPDARGVALAWLVDVAVVEVFGGVGRAKIGVG
jgi:hypothetical protein